VIFSIISLSLANISQSYFFNNHDMQKISEKDKIQLFRLEMIDLEKLKVQKEEEKRVRKENLLFFKENNFI
jgi:hypothetical protein